MILATTIRFINPRILVIKLATIKIKAPFKKVCLDIFTLKQKQIREMHSALSRGDKIITIGGLHGTIDAVDDEVMVILVNDNRKLTFDKSAVREVVNPD